MAHAEKENCTSRGGNCLGSVLLVVIVVGFWVVNECTAPDPRPRDLVPYHRLELPSPTTDFTDYQNVLKARYVGSPSPEVEILSRKTSAD